MPPSKVFRRRPRAGRIVAGAALPVAIAAALSFCPAPALCEAPGATSFGDAVLPRLPERPDSIAPPEIEWVPPAQSGATSAAQPPRAPAPASAPEIPGAGAGGSEAAGEPTSPGEQLAAARREAIEAARQTQKGEQAVAAIRHEIDLLGSDADASWRELAESRDEQARLLGAIVHIAHGPARGGDDPSPVERLHADALMRDLGPALRARLLALTGEITRLQALHRRIDAEKTEEAAARQALASARERLRAAVARRNALLVGMSAPQGIDAALRIADAEREATNLAELVKRAETATENGDKQRQRSRTGGAGKKLAPLSQSDDPTRPRDLRSLAQESGLAEEEPSQSAGPRQEAVATAAPPHPLLVPPVVGTLVQPGEPGAKTAPNDGLSLNAVPGATVVAPFDGRIVYAGPFRDRGRVLIIRHDRHYYSALAGLGRIDAKVGDWVLAGEPVGAMRDTPSPRSGADARELGESDPGGLLYYELRRDGSPVDPQPWLAMSGTGPASETGSGR